MIKNFLVKIKIPVRRKKTISDQIEKLKKPIKKDIAKAERIKKKKKSFIRKFVEVTVLALLLFAACGFGSVLGVYIAIKQNLPSIDELEEYAPDIITYIYSDGMEVVGEFAREKRIEVPYEKIPDVLTKAIIATEDPRFFSHNGVDYRGIFRAVKENIKIKLKKIKSKWQGGSTITQQLARKLFLHPRQTMRRKFKEALLAIQIEKKYTKQQILTLYCNQFNLGHGAYGVEAASQFYFGKSVSELNLEEAAMITGIFRRPSVLSPYKRPEDTLKRRNHVIRRMVEVGYITAAEGKETIAKPIKVLPLRRKDAGIAAYFREEVRRYIVEKYGSDALYRKGLKIYTTLNMKYQRYAEEALRWNLRNLDKALGWRDDKRNLVAEGIEELEDIENIKEDFLGDWPPYNWLKLTLKEGDILEAVVLSVEKEEATVKVKDFVGKLVHDDASKDWTKSKDLKSILKRGDVIHIKIKEMDEEKKELLVSLEQEPLLESGFLAIEPQTGQIKAMVGGYDFRRSEWNNTTQAMRQAGSAIKPIIYTAAIESRLFTPATIIVDEPTDFIDKWTGEPYSPGNYDQKYKGAVTVRKGLEESRNILTVKLLQSISAQKGVEFCRKFGIASPVYPYLSLALGAPSVRMMELVSAYTVFPNKGVRVKPYFLKRIEDKEGNILEENTVEEEEVVSPQVAYVMTSLLQGVVNRGTAWSVRSYSSLKDWPLGGKTGTTDKYTDAWFVGFSPSLCAGVWVGNKTAVPIGERKSGAVAALPAWRLFFSRVVRDKKRLMEENGEKALAVEEFEIPTNLSFLEIDRKTGLIATPICLFALREVFLPGTEPDRFCSHEDHMRILDYYGVKKK